MDDRNPTSENAGTGSASSGTPSSAADASDGQSAASGGGSANNKRRRRGSRGGQGKSSSGSTGAAADAAPTPRIGDTMPIPAVPPPGPARRRDDTATSGSSGGSGTGGGQSRSSRNRRRRSRGGGGNSGGAGAGNGRSEHAKSDNSTTAKPSGGGQSQGSGRRRGRSGRAQELSAETLERRRGRERDGKPLGRYVMCVQVRDGITQVGVLEGRNLIEHYVSRPADDVSQIHGNIYLGKVQNVLPGMEAAFVDIATPKNAVLYRGDVQFDPDDVDSAGEPRIEEILKNKQLILCQVTKNPIGAKGARLTQEVSLPGRFVVLIPNSSTYGISKRLPDDVRRRLRSILDRVKPDQHGLIVRTAAEHATEAELTADMELLLAEWTRIEEHASKANRPTLLHREPELAVRVIREEFTADYRKVVIDDRRLYDDIREYVAAFNPELVDRIEFYDRTAEALSVFEEYHVHEQVHKALDRKVWLPSGGSLIIEHTEALTVIDVNTGKNVGKDNLEATVFANNLEAAAEIAHQLRLRDIGGIIVIDFIDMEIKQNRAAVVEAFRDALSRDKTRTQVFDISELGLVEMTRKRIGEGLLTEFSSECPDCAGRGVIVDHTLLQ